MRRAVVLVSVSVACACGAQREQASDAHQPTAGAEAHVMSAPEGSQGQTTEATILERLRGLARTLPAGATAERAAVGDLAYPKDQTENEAMAGYGLLLVTGVTRHPEELPLSAVKLRSAAGELQLGRAARRRNEVTDAEVREAFGSHRVDELYYFPLAFTQLECTVLVDFAKNRQNFALLKYPDADGLPSNLQALEPGAPNNAAATAFAEREFGWRAAD